MSNMYNVNILYILTNVRPVLSSERAPSTKTRQKLSNSNKHLVMRPRWGSTPRLTDWLTVSRNVTLTLTHIILHSSINTEAAGFSFKLEAFYLSNGYRMLLPRG
jgi:hypothetical protein